MRSFGQIVLTLRRVVVDSSCMRILIRIGNKDHKSCDFTYANVHENCMSSVQCANSILNTSKQKKNLLDGPKTYLG